jgi:hypothetical protein
VRLFKLLRRLSLIWYDIFFVKFFLSNFIARNCAKEFSGNARIQIRIGVVNILKFTSFVKCKHLSWSMNHELRNLVCLMEFRIQYAISSSSYIEWNT